MELGISHEVPGSFSYLAHFQCLTCMSVSSCVPATSGLVDKVLIVVAGLGFRRAKIVIRHVAPANASAHSTAKNATARPDATRPVTCSSRAGVWQAVETTRVSTYGTNQIHLFQGLYYATYIVFALTPPFASAILQSDNNSLSPTQTRGHNFETLNHLFRRVTIS